MEKVQVPETVALVYRVVDGDTHIFQSKGIKGLVHVGSHDRAVAFEKVITALNQHVGEAYGCEATYKCAMTYDEFVSNIGIHKISGRFIELTLDHAA